MPKQKSSASSATKKKHARKTAAREEQLAARAAAEELQEELDEAEGSDDDGAVDAEDKPESSVALEAAPVPAPIPAPAITEPEVLPPPLLDKRGKRIKDSPSANEKQRGQKGNNSNDKKVSKKQSKKHAKGQAPPPPRKKQYIPPPKPPRTNVDPVDTYGLGVIGAGYERIPADRVVSLRLLNKKDSLSVERGLDEVLAWINEAQRASNTHTEETDDDDASEEALVQIAEALSVWTHHLPRLLSHASRRVRYLTASIHSLLLHQGTPSLLAYTLPAFTTPATLEREEFFSSQLCATFDPDRQVRSLSISNWKALADHVSPQDYLGEILSSLTDTILESPAGTYSAQEQARRKHLSDEERMSLQEESDRKITQLTASIEAFAYLLQYCKEDNAQLFSKVTESETFWSFLSRRSMDAPQVRRSTWRTLGLLLSHEQRKTLLEDSLPNITRLAPTAAFIERDYQTQNMLWEPLIALFRAYPSIWKRPLRSPNDDDEEHSSLEATASSSSSEQETDASAVPPRQGKISSTIASFFDLLQVGFYGNASSGYQATPVLVHTIPTSVFPRTPSNLETLFSSFWGAYSGTAIDSSATVSFVQCLIDLVRLSLESEEAAKTSATQVLRLWEYYLQITPLPSKSLSLSRIATVQELEKGLTALLSRYPSVFHDTWTSLATSMEEAIRKSSTSLPYVSQALIQLVQSQSEQIAQLAKALLHNTTRIVATSETTPESASFFTALLSNEHTKDVANEVAELDDYLAKLGPEEYQLLLAYLNARTDRSAKDRIWKAICEQLRTAIAADGLATLLPFVRASQAGSSLSRDFANAALDEAIVARISQNMDNDDIAMQVIGSLLQSPSPFVTESFAESLLTAMVEYLENQLVVLSSEETASTAEAHINGALSLLSLASGSQIHKTAAHYPAFVTVFQWAELAPLVRTTEPDSTDRAQAILQKLIQEKGDWTLADLYAMTATRLGELVLEQRCRISSLDLSEALFRLCSLPEAARQNLLSAFLPQEDDMERMAQKVYTRNIDPRMSVLDITVSGANVASTDPSFEPTSDAVYHRAVLAWLSVLSEDRRMGSQVDWFLAHSILVSETAKDQLAVSTCSDDRRADMIALQSLASRISTHLSSQIVNRQSENWQMEAVKSLRQITRTQEAPTSLLASLLSKVTDSSGETYASRVFSRLLSMLIHQSESTLQDKEAWLDLAKHWQKPDIRVSLAIVAGLQGTLDVSSRLQRYQGEVASSLTSVKPQDVIERGNPMLRLLRLLAGIMSQEEDLLPANRAIFLLQALQKWQLFDGADDNNDADPVDVAGPAVLRINTISVATIQDLSGAHWDFMFDLAEYLIESFDWAEASTFAGLSAACTLLEEIRNRANDNKTFKSLVKTQLNNTIALLRPKFLASPTPSEASLSLMASMARLLSGGHCFSSDDLPALLDTLDRLTGPTLALAFDICSDCIRKQVDEMTITSETTRSDDPADRVQLGLPDEVVSKLRLFAEHTANATATDEKVHLYLYWLLVSRYFSDTTAVLKSTFTDQLRRTGFVSDALLPTVYAHTNVSDRTRGTDLSGWQVEEFYVSDLAEPDEQDLCHLAAHAYYQALRTVPSLVRSEWESIKSKQFSSAVETFTSRAFSPLLIQTELARVQSAEAKESLQDDDMSVKILPNVNEVKAIYTVDEQPLEIAIRIPTNFPLTPVEVRDVKRIGVPEATWRAWLLNVQLTISNQNGSIADALTLFKTNAARHFEGVEACAICYSVVSVTDRSMPSKRCRTCKQLFHPSCLYKWFATSHGSSCPLCRSLF